MNSNHSISRLLSCSVLMALLQLSAWATDASAHVLTIYQNVAADMSTVHGYTDLWDHDNPGGCHGSDGYYTYSTLYGPTGDSYGDGAYNAHSSLPMTGGDYGLLSNGRVGCVCGADNFAAPAWTGMKITTTFMPHSNTVPGACYYYGLSCTSGNPSCTLPSTLAVTGAPQPCAPHRAVVWLVVNGNCNELGSYPSGSGGSCS